jgi:signal transduction histidine kinase
MSDKYFKVSSALKNLIGSDLITDNFVAVFELVKNSFDARATEVKITFEDIYSKNAKVIIQDNGKGMDYEDLTEKWLFLGYSAKRDGTEDYRDKIKSGRVYAGAKGVGRFSCDRLGKFLNLITVSEKPKSKIENIFVDWVKFEKNQKVEFKEIPVTHNVLAKTKYDLKKGTVLEITGVPTDFWNRDNFKKLKEKLSKLIRPDLNTSDEVQKFKIILSVPDEHDKDREVLKKFKQEGNTDIEQYYNTVNGEIKNFVFNELDIKTTKIESTIDDKGIITTRLTDRENYIYLIKEKSEFPLLSNIGVTLYFLNKSAKDTFKRRTGVAHVDFGSVFIYKNGFRIYPYGERRDDSLGLENRALQGYARYVGLRSLIGEISITGENPELRETTSRGDGLVKTKTYNELTNSEDGYLIKILRRLEKYVVEVTDWGVNAEDETENISSEKVKENLVKLIANISDDKSFLDLKYNKDIIDLISNKEGKSAKKLVKNFKRIAAESNNKILYKEAERIEKAITTSLKRADSAEKELGTKIQEKKKIEQELEKKKEQLAVRDSIEAQDIENVTNLHHQVFVIADTVKSILKEMYNKITIDEGEITRTELIQFMDELISENKKIESLSRFGMRAIFEDFNSKSENDISDFLSDYVSKISNYFKTNKIKVEYKQLTSKPFKASFRPLDISIIIDNIINNSKKHKATQLSIITESFSSKFEITFRDNGIGFSKEITDINEVFKKGFSTTKSTGLGLYHINNIIKEYKWSIAANTAYKKGAEFLITIKK